MFLRGFYRRGSRAFYPSCSSPLSRCFPRSIQRAVPRLSIPSKRCVSRREDKPMVREILLQAWLSLRRQPTRSLLTMVGIIWGIVAVTMLLAYGSDFRRVLMSTFDVFGHDIILCWPGTTAEQAGGERAGKTVKFEQP